MPLALVLLLVPLLVPLLVSVPLPMITLLPMLLDTFCFFLSWVVSPPPLSAGDAPAPVDVVAPAAAVVVAPAPASPPDVTVGLIAAAAVVASLISMSPLGCFPRALLVPPLETAPLVLPLAAGEAGDVVGAVADAVPGAKKDEIFFAGGGNLIGTEQSTPV